MQSGFKNQLFPLGLVLFSLGLAACKALMLTNSINAGWWVFVILISLDFFYISLILGTAIIQGSLTAGYSRQIVNLVLMFLTGFYLVDSCVLLALDDHPSIFDIARYSTKGAVVLSFFDLKACLVVLLFLLSWFYHRMFTLELKRMTFGLVALTFFGGVLSTFYAPPLLARYAMLNPTNVLDGFRPQSVVSSYSSEEMEFYGQLETAMVEVPPGKPNVVLVVVESLSSINSARVSGGGDLLRRFDELAQEGLLFRNFFANHQASEGGIISLLSGFPPMHFPTATPYMFDEFAVQASITNEYRQQGYLTEFLTNSDLRFIGLDRFLNGLGFDRSRGRDEVEAMRTAPRIVQDAPADDLLYAEALSTVRELSVHQQPFLLVVATTSTHLPYTHPHGGPDTAAAVWDWSLQQLATFYRQLSELGYFRRGILLVTGDHRQMRPLTRLETQRYGDSARARVPLLVVGKGYSGGSADDRFFQQSDLLRSLEKIKQRHYPLSPYPIWVERYNRKYGRVDRIDRLSVFDQKNGGIREYRLKVLGNRIEWLGKKPEFSQGIEIQIHRQRSLHQKIRNGASDTCQPSWRDRLARPSDRHGLELGIFEQSNLDGRMELGSLPGTRKQRVETVKRTEFPALPQVGALLFTGFINIEDAGIYRFRVGSGQVACMSVDKKVVLYQRHAAQKGHEISLELSAGLHFFDLRFADIDLYSTPVLEWVTPGSRYWWWRSVPAERFYLIKRT